MTNDLSMSNTEIAQASLALDAWLTSQDIPASCRAPVLLQWLGTELVSQGDTVERYTVGCHILKQLLQHYADDALAVAKKYGVR